jgi:hypothetical protein
LQWHVWLPVRHNLRLLRGAAAGATRSPTSLAASTEPATAVLATAATASKSATPLTASSTSTVATANTAAVLRPVDHLWQHSLRWRCLHRAGDRAHHLHGWAGHIYGWRDDHLLGYALPTP